MFNDAVYVGCECPFCGKYHDVRVSETDYWNWESGELAQNAFPILPQKRENFSLAVSALIAGTRCSEARIKKW